MRLHDAWHIRLEAEREAKIRSLEGEVERLRLTDAERVAVHFMLRHAAHATDHSPFPDSADYIVHHKVISAMMERLK